MKTVTGKAKVKDDSTYIYAGHILDITSIYIEWNDVNSKGVHPIGSRDYKLSLIGTEFMESRGYKETCINDKHLEIIELYETIKLPLTHQETVELVTFIKAQPLSMNSSEELLQLFIDNNTNKCVINQSQEWISPMTKFNKKNYDN